MPFRIGIDLGTTYCVMAKLDPNNGEPVVIEAGKGKHKHIIPSAVYFENGSHTVGLDAKRKFVSGSENSAVIFKRIMGEKDENGNDSVCFIAEKGTSYECAYTATELTTFLLAYLKEAAEKAVNDTISGAVITCPAYFHDNARDCIKRAAEAVGLKIIEILEEPAAAALAYGRRHWRIGARVLIYDLGGGTFDVSVVDILDNLLMKVLRTDGTQYFGGKDFDASLLRIALRKLAIAADTDESSITESEMSAIRGKIEDVKIKLTDFQSTNISSIVDGKSVSAEITREEFELECKDLLVYTGKFIENVLCDMLNLFPESDKDKTLVDKLRLYPDRITDVLLVGGSTLMPCVTDYLFNLFGKAPITQANPDTAVAEGAAMRTNNKTVDTVWDIRKETKEKQMGDAVPQIEKVVPVQSFGDIVLIKSATHTMGVLTDKDDGTTYNRHIILSGTRIPCKSAKKFKYPVSKNKSNELYLYLLQGDSENPKECDAQSKYVVTGIRYVNNGEIDGTLIRVQYSYDKNGSIQVQARQEDDNVDLPISKAGTPNDFSQYLDNKKESRPEMNADIVHKYKVVTFSNVTWQKYDNISFHESGAQYNAPTRHVIANEKDIEFHGYNISAMDEGVYYTINANDSFEIECDINTSEIQEHPENGFVKIELGIISARLNQAGGSIFLNGKSVKTVGSRFRLKMTVSGGSHYEAYTDGVLAGKDDMASINSIDVRFGMTHDAHHCHIIQRTYISNIEMKHQSGNALCSEDDEAETW